MQFTCSYETHVHRVTFVQHTSRQKNDIYFIYYHITNVFDANTTTRIWRTTKTSCLNICVFALRRMKCALYLYLVTHGPEHLIFSTWVCSIFAICLQTEKNQWKLFELLHRMMRFWRKIDGHWNKKKIIVNLHFCIQFFKSLYFLFLFFKNVFYLRS